MLATGLRPVQTPGAIPALQRALTLLDVSDGSALAVGMT